MGEMTKDEFWKMMDPQRTRPYLWGSMLRNKELKLTTPTHLAAFAHFLYDGDRARTASLLAKELDWPNDKAVEFVDNHKQEIAERADVFVLAEDRQWEIRLENYSSIIHALVEKLLENDKEHTVDDYGEDNLWVLILQRSEDPCDFGNVYRTIVSATQKKIEEIFVWSFNIEASESKWDWEIEKSRRGSIRENR